MAKDDKGFDLKRMLQNAVDSAKTAVKDIDIDDIKDAIQEKAMVARNFAESAKDTVKDAVNDIDLENVKNKAVEAADNAIENLKSIKISKSDEQDETATKDTVAISTRNAMKIIYYLMAADGDIFHNEEEKFDEIGKELDPSFKENREDIVQECKEYLSRELNADEHLEIVEKGAMLAIQSSVQTTDTFITPKLLVWNLLTIAYSDEHYNDAEKQIVRSIAKELGVSETDLLEMENSILTLMDLEKELAWIKTTDRPYIKVETVVNEIVDRKNVIFDSVKELIAF